MSTEPATGPGQVRIGTSGWHYGHWVGHFYPQSLEPGAYLPYYARHFVSVEINATFYRLPKPATFAAWRDGTPADFIFACKASRFVTHMKKLKDPEESLHRFLGEVDCLGPKLGPLLFQLPPRWHVNAARLEGFLAALPTRYQAAFEFRDESWFDPGIYDLLARHNRAFCIYDLAGRRAPLELTADFVYLRLHGPGPAYEGSYDRPALAAWARRITTWRDAGRDVYCYFDNDQRGYAIRDARRLLDLVAGSGIPAAAADPGRGTA